MNGFSPSKLIDQELLEVEAIMRHPLDDQHVELENAINYILNSGGKRVRPLICLLVGQICDADRLKLVKLAAAVEILHTATLVHDDLIDGSMFRRGIPTLNSKWSAGATVLTGDFFFARAASLSAETESIPVIKLFAQTVATLVNGEVDQMFTKPCTVSRESYLKRIYSKTASLFETSSSAPALLEDNNPSFASIFKEFGVNVGMAFQIIDDLLDFSGSQDTTGKPVGIDLRSGLVTLPVIHFVSMNPNNNLARAIVNGECPRTEENVIEVISAVQASDAMKLSFHEAEVFISKAKKALVPIKESQEKTALINLADFITQRTL